MFSSGPDLTKLKTNLRLTINRLKLLEKKKTENALKARKEIADYIQAGKDDRARIRVEHIVREDYYVEAMELVEMYCDLLLARFGLIQMQKELDPGLEEAIATLIWVAPRMQADVAELKCVGDILGQKYGKEFANECRQNRLNNVSEKVMHKLSVQAPPRSLVERYMAEIAKSYNVPFEPDLNLLESSGPGDDLINFDNPSIGGGNGNALDNRYYQPPVQPQPPMQPPVHHQPPLPPGQIGFVGDQGPAFGTGALYPSGNYGPPAGHPSVNASVANSEKPPLPPDNPIGHGQIAPGHGSAPPGFFDAPPDYSSMIPHHATKPSSNNTQLNLPDIPTGVTPGNSVAQSGSTDVDFDDLTRRFDELKKRK